MSKLTTGRMGRLATTALALGAAATLVVSCSSEDDPGPDYRPGGGDSPVPGAVTMHEMERVESVRFDGAGRIRGLEQTQDNRLIAHMAPADGAGESTIAVLDPDTGDSEQLHTVPLDPGFAEVTGNEEIDSGFGISQYWRRAAAKGEMPLRGDALWFTAGGAWGGQWDLSEINVFEIGTNPEPVASVGTCAIPMESGIPADDFLGPGAGEELNDAISGTNAFMTSTGDALLVDRDPINAGGKTNGGNGNSVQARVVLDGEDVIEKDLTSVDGVDFKNSEADTVQKSKSFFDIDDINIVDTGLVGGLSELECLTRTQSNLLTESRGTGERPDRGRNQIMAVINHSMADTFAGKLKAMQTGGGSDGRFEQLPEFRVAEFADDVTMVLIDGSTGAVTDAFTLPDLKDGQQITSVAIDQDDPTLMWVTVEGDDHIHLVRIKD